VKLKIDVNGRDLQGSPSVLLHHHDNKEEEEEAVR